MHESYSAPIQVKDLASLVGPNPSYFGTLFKKHTGTTVNAYINWVRINNAENLLASGEFSIAETAYKCGYDVGNYVSSSSV
ncbi:AraC family transcriptional regulator [Paenibacillus nanensis]|uniref:AraC family transcriptional regulator n=1 Tax=Paenibacillus nanensis TaxID=393251 RepID=A0A3A1UT68_9BACL|nr:AraC family transcriptional regulator [Paenibacillus nanensis]